jgi:hypothetical protein
MFGIITFIFNLEIRKFVLFGVLKGYITRIHKYPVLESLVFENPIQPGYNPTITISNTRFQGLHGSMNNLTRYTVIPLDLVIHRRCMDGSHSYDEICTNFEITAKELDQVVDAVGARVVFK